MNHKGGDKGSSAGLRINAVTSGDHRIASGNKVTAPVTLAAFSTAVLGDSTASNKDGGYHNGGDCKDVDKGSSAGPRIAAVASVDHSIASGNHLIAPVAPPITEGAVSAAVLGDSSVINKDGTCTDGDKGSSAGPRIGPATSDDHSIASGNPQWLLPAGLVLMLAGLLLMLVKRQEQ